MAIRRFNLNRDARPLATQHYSVYSSLSIMKFQSQPRCQAPGDDELLRCMFANCIVSISTEMPGPWRRCNDVLVSSGGCTSFNLNRDARPLAT